MKRKKTHKSRTLKSVLGAALEIPADVLGGVPRMTLMGGELLTVEDHKGIMKYTQNEIILNSLLGMIEVTGRELELRSILPEEIQINGLIEGIFIRRKASPAT